MSNSTRQTGEALPPQGQVGIPSERTSGEQLARLVHLAQAAGLSEATRAAVAELLWDLGRDAASTQGAAAPPPLPPAATAVSAASPSLPAAATEVSRIALRLRQLVDAEAPWDQIMAAGLALCQAHGVAAAGARLVELAVLRAPVAELGPLLLKVAELTPEFWFAVHPAVRSHLLARLWRLDEGLALSYLEEILTLARDRPDLAPLERLYLWHRLVADGDLAAALAIDLAHGDELGEAAEHFGADVGLLPDRLRLERARVAIELGYKSHGEVLLEGIAADTPEREEALALLLGSGAVGEDVRGPSRYAELIAAEPDAKVRLQLLAEFLAATRGLGGFRDRNRPALNDLLRSPLSWVPAEAESLAALSELLVVNRDVDVLLPNLWATFVDQALEFRAPLLDSALWSGPRALADSGDGRDQFWRGVALLHQFVCTGPAAEASLWEARELIESARRRWAKPLPHTWKSLHQAALNWVAKNRYLLETDRQAMLRQLRVALDIDQVSPLDLEDYLSHLEAPPLRQTAPGPTRQVLARLSEVAAAKKTYGTAVALIIKSGELAHLVRADLDRLWQLAVLGTDSDLAWRVATVVHGRGALVPVVRHAWEISGERRSHYPFQAMPPAVVDVCLEGLSAVGARLAHACLKVGGALPELLALFDTGARAVKPAPLPPDSPEARAERALGGLPWLTPPRRRMRLSFESEAAGASLPAFMQVLPTTPYAFLVARLCERLGINAWNWRLSTLGAQVAEVIPRLAVREDLRQQGSKVARWLRDLTPEQRTAWQEFSTLSRLLADDDAALALAKFVCRLGLALLPDHATALASLRAMRAPVAVIWDLECWLLSRRYSSMRQARGLQCRVPLPTALTRLTTIHGGSAG